MPSRSRARGVAALAAGLLFVTANMGPVVCAVTHHARHAPDHGAVHRGHGGTPAPGAPAASVDRTRATPPGCPGMSHCGVTVNGVTAAATMVPVPVAHPRTAVLTTGTRPHAATFSPPTPPPRA